MDQHVREPDERGHILDGADHADTDYLRWYCGIGYFEHVYGLIFVLH